MIRPLLCVASEGISVDRKTGSVSVFSVLEQITAQGFPVLFQRLALFVLWEKDADDPARVAGRLVIDVMGQELFAQAVEINFQDKLRNRYVVRMNGLILPRPGLLRFAVRLEGGD
jgi:hypothetical protein